MDEEKKIISLFAQEFEAPSESIVFGVQERIKKYRAHKARQQFIFGVISLPLSVLFFIPIVRLLFTEITNSGFFEYVKLIFSDIAGVLPHWQEAGIALAESFPAVGAILFLCILSFFLFSLRSLYMGKSRLIYIAGFHK
jgi:hypothetical protein